MLKSKRRRLEFEEGEPYQMLVKGNSTNTSGNSQHVKAGITATVAALKNVKQQKDRAPDIQRDVENVGGFRCIKIVVTRVSKLKCL